MINRSFNPMEGTMVSVNVLFMDESGTPTDPTGVTITASHATGSVNVVPVAQAVGVYRGEFVVTSPGTWVVQARGAGALVVVEETTFKVRKSEI